MFDSLPEILTNTETAKLLRISTRTLLRMTEAGEIPYLTVGSKKMFLRRDIEELIWARYRGG